MVENWGTELSLLLDVAVSQPQATYTSFVAGYQHKFTYFLRTISGIEEYLSPLEEVIRHKFIPAITGGHIVNDNERRLLALPVRLGGLGMRIFAKDVPLEYSNSRRVTTTLINQILDRNEGLSKTVAEIHSENRRIKLSELDFVYSEMNEEARRVNDANRRTAVPNWLTTLPLKEWGYNLNKQQLWDAIKIRYNWNLERISSKCICGATFDVGHALLCKKGGFVTSLLLYLQKFAKMLGKSRCYLKLLANNSTRSQRIFQMKRDWTSALEVSGSLANEYFWI